MGKLISVLFVLLCSASSVAKISPLKCSPRGLDIKNCSLTRGDLRIQIRDDKVNSFNGVHRKIVEVPLAGENVEWKSWRLVRLNRSLFLEGEVWDEASPQTGVSELRWLVYKLEGVEPKLKLNERVKSRKLISEEKSKKNYEYDRPVGHKIFRKGKKLKWKLGFKEGEF